jgi:DNA-damage-inducible protein D
MTELIAKEYTRFESIKHRRDDGTEYWSARELSIVLEYADWRNFIKVVEKAMIACEVSKFNVSDHFGDVTKMVALGSGTTRKVKDYDLTRYACYLIVQNGDPRKEVIALGQTYFAIQTHRQEIADRFNLLDEDAKRLIVRGDIKQWNQLLAEAARDAGVITAVEFATFQNAGYMGLYGGETVDDIHKRKELDVKEKLLDFMGSEELIANLFRISQTESKLKRDNVKGKRAATATHYAVGKEVRGAIEKIGGTMPEDLPKPDKSIPEIEKEVLKKLKDKAKHGQLMLDE